MGLFDLFKKEKVNTAPENDTEKWILGTYAMWSVNYDGEWKYIAGVKEADRRNRATMSLMLRRDWCVTNKEELFDMANHLTQIFDKEVAGWDLCRGCQILGMGFIANLISREEMVQHSLVVCRQMQKVFQSWDELYESYLNGYRDWRNGAGEGAQEDIRKREDICRKLKEDFYGPLQLKWEQEF